MRNSKNRLNELRNKLSDAQVLQANAARAIKGGTGEEFPIGDPPRWIED